MYIYKQFNISPEQTACRKDRRSFNIGATRSGQHHVPTVLPTAKQYLVVPTVHKCEQVLDPDRSRWLGWGGGKRVGGIAVPIENRSQYTQWNGQLEGAVALNTLNPAKTPLWPLKAQWFLYVPPAT